MGDTGNCVYIFLDESGNLDFGPNGTRYFVLTSVAMTRPFTWFDSLDSYKYDCIEYGLTSEYFHCAEDNRHVRARVFDIIRGNLASLRIDSLIVEKGNVPANLREAREFYPAMLGRLLSEVVAGEVAARRGSGRRRGGCRHHRYDTSGQPAPGDRAGRAHYVVQAIAARRQVSAVAPPVPLPLRLAGSGLLLLGGASEMAGRRNRLVSIH